LGEEQLVEHALASGFATFGDDLVGGPATECRGNLGHRHPLGLGIDRGPGHDLTPGVQQLAFEFGWVVFGSGGFDAPSHRFEAVAAKVKQGSRIADAKVGQVFAGEEFSE